MPKSPHSPDTYDFFVSYARADNATGWITRFVEALQEEQRRFTGAREFRVFFDKEDIRSLDDWRNRIHESLAASRLLVAFISPNYFASEWCRREWHTWIDVEIAEHVLSDGAAPIYFVEVPDSVGKIAGLPEQPTLSEQQVAARMAELNGLPMAHDNFSAAVATVVRQMRDSHQSISGFVKVSCEEGVGALRRADVHAVPELAADIARRIDDMNRAVVHQGAPPVKKLDNVPTSAPPQPLPDEVAFTVYRPNAIAPGMWETLLAFAHLAERRPDSPKDSPDPIEQVRAEAERILGLKHEHYRAVDEDRAYSIPGNSEITFLPVVPGIEFNPERAHFCWKEDVHRQEFRLRAPLDAAGKTFSGKFDVYLGLRLLASLPLRLKCEAGAQTSANRKTETSTASPSQRIFPSYSHKDAEVVEIYESVHETSGNTYLRDVKNLRTGEEFWPKLCELIRTADYFQLFWSGNSMLSGWCRKEWEYALSLGRPDFIRPIYWQDPRPEDKAAGLPPEEIGKLHFSFLGKFTPASPAAPLESPFRNRDDDFTNCPDVDKTIRIPLPQEPPSVSSKPTIPLRTAPPPPPPPSGVMSKPVSPKKETARISLPSDAPKSTGPALPKATVKMQQTQPLSKGPPPASISTTAPTTPSGAASSAPSLSPQKKADTMTIILWVIAFVGAIAAVAALVIAIPLLVQALRKS